MPDLNCRTVYGKALLEMGRINKNVIAVDADMCLDTSEFFAKEFPSRQIDVGIAEQNLMNVAAGIATTGKARLRQYVFSFCQYEGM